MNCDVGEATEGLGNELWRRWNNGKLGEWAPTFPSLHLRHNSFSNPSVALPMSQLILQPFFRFSYVTSSSLNSPGEPPMAYPTCSTLTVFVTDRHWCIDDAGYTVQPLSVYSILGYINNSQYTRKGYFLRSSTIHRKTSLVIIQEHVNCAVLRWFVDAESYCPFVWATF